MVIQDCIKKTMLMERESTSNSHVPVGDDKT